MLLTCKCGANNRIPSLGTRQRIRCGACKHTFSPAELVRAVPEAPPVRAEPTEDEGDIIELIRRMTGEEIC